MVFLEAIAAAVGFGPSLLGAVNLCLGAISVSDGVLDCLFAQFCSNLRLSYL